MNKTLNIIIAIIIAVLVIVSAVALIRKLTEKSDTDKANFDYTVENIDLNPVYTKNR